MAETAAAQQAKLLEQYLTPDSSSSPFSRGDNVIKELHKEVDTLQQKNSGVFLFFSFLYHIYLWLTCYIK